MRSKLGCDLRPLRIIGHRDNDVRLRASTNDGVMILLLHLPRATGNVAGRMVRVPILDRSLPSAIASIRRPGRHIVWSD